MASSSFKTPVYDAIAYPGHFLWAPYRLFGVNVSVGLIAGSILLIALKGTPFGVLGVLYAVLQIGVGHAFIAWQYRKDPHVEMIWIYNVRRFVRRFNNRPMIKEPGIRYDV